MTTTARPKVTGEDEARRMLRQGLAVGDVAELADLPERRVHELLAEIRGSRTAEPATTARPAGTKLRSCDYAGCKALATSSAGGWDFCDQHVAADQRDRPTPTAAATTPPASAAPPATPVGPPPSLLERAAASQSKKVQRLAGRIEPLMKQLADLLAAEEAEAEQRAVVEREKARARAEVERLEKQLAAAKAKLAPPKRPKPARPAADGPPATGPEPCADCGGPITRPAGTAGRWPSRCTTCRAAA